MMVQYKKFQLDSLFDIRYGKFIPKRKAGTKVPFVTTRSGNNGIAYYVDSKPMCKGDALTIASDGSVGETYYQDKPFSASNIVVIMEPHEDVRKAWTPQAALYLSALIKQYARAKYDWGRKYSVNRVRATQLELPVTPAGQPDFAYMTVRIRELEAERIRELEAYLRVTGLDDTTLSVSEAQALTKTVKWKKFKINDFFKVLPVKHKLIKRELLSCGQYPCYSSDTSNYGILGYTNNPEFHIDDKHSYLIFGDHTRSMRIAESDFSVLDNVKVLCGQKLSKEKLLFIETMWHKAIPNLGYARHWSIAKNVDFLLPVTSNGDVDFDYMQNYIRATEKQTIKGVVEYKDRVIEETKKVVNR